MVWPALGSRTAKERNRTLLAVKRLRRGGGGGAQDGTEGGSFARDVNCAAGRLRAERLQKLLQKLG